MIPFNDLRPANYDIRTSLEPAVKRVMYGGIFLGGDEVAAFEEEWSRYCGVKHTVACASGQDALMLAVVALKRRRGYTGPAAWVVIQANTLPATKIAMERSGNFGAFTDVDERGILIPQSQSCPVLLYGRHYVQNGEYEPELFDACQAHGWSPPKNAICGWSGYPTKNLGGFGDCGWMTTNNGHEANAARKFAQGYHSRMSELNAAVLRTKLPHLDRWNAERADIAAVYYNELPEWAEPACRPGEPTNHHIFAVLVDRRDELEKHMLENGVQTKVHYREPLAELPGARRWCDRVLSLPMWPGLTPMQVGEVCDVMRMFR